MMKFWATCTRSVGFWRVAATQSGASNSDASIVGLSPPFISTRSIENTATAMARTREARFFSGPPNQANRRVAAIMIAADGSRCWIEPDSQLAVGPEFESSATPAKDKSIAEPVPEEARIAKAQTPASMRNAVTVATRRVASSRAPATVNPSQPMAASAARGSIERTAYFDEYRTFPSRGTSFCSAGYTGVIEPNAHSSDAPMVPHQKYAHTRRFALTTPATASVKAKAPT